jgi:hypothetical protein
MPSPLSSITRRAAATLTLSASMGFASAACGDDKAARLGPGKKDEPGVMEALWADLEKDEITATRALLNLADRRDEMVTFLKAKMRPLKITDAEVRALLLKLGSENPNIWRPAFEELEYFDPRLAIDLETLMDRYKEAPARQRMVEILSGWEAGQLAGKEIRLRRLLGRHEFNFIAQPLSVSWWAEHRIDRINIHSPDNIKKHPVDRNNVPAPDNFRKKWTRAVLAIVLLEHIGTPGAVAILKDMATGHPDAQPTKVARGCLERVGKSGKAL